MRQVVPLLVTMLFAMVLLASGIGTATAEPRKNQISVPVTCQVDDQTVTYTLVFNGEGNAGQVLDFSGPNNIIPKRYVITYLDPRSGEEIARDEFNRGKRVGQGDLIQCAGQITTEIFGLGRVTAVFEFEGLITPQGKQ
jgi:hypothetical protein